ncbi:MAG TPA: PKD domain-containing protein, partial [Myxococcaceae bacterium]|nr:PKD domain-containing protein [Myxococcaceae bacterium]
NVYFEVLGTEPHRELVVEWRNVRHRNLRFVTPADTLSFQVVFFEDKPDILFNYKDVEVGSGAYDRGAGATVGVQIAGDIATLHGFEAESVTSGSALLWTMSGTVNAAPVVESFSVSPGSLTEGELLDLETRFMDPDGAGDGPWTVQYDLDYPGWFTPGLSQVAQTQGPTTTQARVLASGEVKVAVRVLDGKNLQSTVRTATVSVADVPPSLVGLSADSTSINESQSIVFTAAFADPGADSPWRVEWDVDYDGTTFTVDRRVTASQPGSLTLTHVFPQDGRYTVAARVVDRDGVTSGVRTLTVDVADLRPGLEVISGATHLKEGQTLELASRFTDPGDGARPWKVQWDFDYDGTTFTVDDARVYASAGSITYKRFLTDAADSTYALRVVDADGSVSEVRTVRVIAEDVSPVLSGFQALSVSASESEPRTVDFRLSAVSGAAVPEVDPVRTLLWDFDGDGVFDALGTTPRALFRYLDNPVGGSTYTARVRVEDEDSYTEATVEVTVLNVAPTLAPLADVRILEGNLLALRAQASDPGQDVLTFGLQGAPEGMSITADGLLLWTPGFAHASATGRPHTVTLVVTDDDGAPASRPLTVTVVWRDSDGDGLPDTWERAHGTDPLRDDAAGDVDGDGVSNLDAFLNDNGGPKLPDTAVAEAPRSGTRVDTASLELTARHVRHVGSLAAVRYQFQLFANAALTHKVRDVT